uniref:CSON011578 protein n=1 Tax=Culicoides sonorensis TaxID=179676 RepID=A0A336M901_CULSO
MPSSITRLDPEVGSDQDNDEEEGNNYGLLEKDEKVLLENIRQENSDYNNDDADKFNRYFDNIDLNEEQKRVFNESYKSAPPPVFGKIDEAIDDYLDSTTVLTTSTTSTVSPYVQEIYKTDDSDENENDDDEMEDEELHKRNHHSNFKKKHRKHHKKHHAQPSSYHLPGINEYYSHSFSPAYHHFSSRLHGINNHNNGGSRGFYQQHNHKHKNKHHHNNKHKVSQTYGTEQRQVKDDAQYQYRSGYRAHYGSDQYRGRISFYDNSNKLETSEDVNHKLSGRAKEKYPYFNKVKSHLEEEDEDLPPYIKKYNRRNKQLIDLLEGTLAPQSQSDFRKFTSHTNNKKNPHWLEEDLFEEQKPSKNKWATEIEATQHPNALPDEHVHLIYDENNNNNNKNTLANISSSKNKSSDATKQTFNLTASSIASNNHSPPFKLSSRAGQFVYHTVTQSPSTNSGGTGYGGVKKKRLPYVAITDRRIHK